MKIIAHRGYSSHYPENTPVAWTEAYKSGADVIEADVRFSKDGVAVLAHDPDLKRVFGREDTPQHLAHADLEHPVGHMGAEPHLVQQLVLQDELTAALDQHPQDVERLQVEWDRAGVALEPCVLRVEPESTEAERHAPGAPPRDRFVTTL